jgi:hypothetical protein
MFVETLASCVCICALSATTLTDSDIAPRFRLTSIRTAPPAVSRMPSMLVDWKPESAASMRYRPGGRFAALNMPVSEDTRLVVVLVAVLMTLIDTPGTAAFVESVTTPVMVPRSDWATLKSGMTHTSAVTTNVINRLLIMFRPSPQTADCSCATRRLRRKTPAARSNGSGRALERLGWR